MSGVRNVPPVIKWAGSKRKVAAAIAALFPRCGRYLEPFVGGGALLPFRPARDAVAGDIIKELIELWRLVERDPSLVAAEYRRRWERRQRDGYTVFYQIRESFNATRNPLDFLFLSRTCVNGLIRFNSEGHFNNSLHHTRKGIHPARMERILREWSGVLKGVDFIASDYRDTLAMAREGDVVFLDPPYAGNRGRYLSESFDFRMFWQELERLTSVGALWVLTIDGRAGGREYHAEIPASIHAASLVVETGHSPFTRLMKTSLDKVQESVYLNFKPSTEQLRQFGQLLGEPVVAVGSQDVQPDLLPP